MPSTRVAESEVKQFVRDWFRKLNKHPEIDEMRPFVAKECKINTPEKKDEPFEDWYKRAKKYRDQIHTIKALEIQSRPDAATVKVLVRWESSDSTSPSPGTRLAFYAAQTWTLERSPPGLRIATYEVAYLLKELQPLADAIRQEDGDRAAVENLLKQGCDVNRKDGAGLTPLMIAAGLGNREIVELLLAAGADVFITDSSMGTTALHKAAQHGSVEIAELLLSKGAFIDAQAPTLGNTPLIDAVWHKHPEMVRYLLGEDARLEIQNRSGGTAHKLAEHYAKNAREGGPKTTEILKLLNERKKHNKDVRESQKLMDAVQRNDDAEVRELIPTMDRRKINEKAPLAGEEFAGYTPLLCAAYLGHDKIVQALLGAKADPTEVDDMIKATAAHKAGHHGKTEAAKVLVDGPFKNPRLLDAQGPYNGYTALHDAIWHGHKDTVEVFLKAGANLYLETHTGHTPLELAELYGYPEIAALIRKKMDEIDHEKIA